MLTRPPSVQWEQVRLPGESGHFIWVWVRPQHLPTAVIVRFPPEVATYPDRPSLTIRLLARCLGIDMPQLAAWQVFGVLYQNNGTTSPDSPIPQPPPGAAPEIAFLLATGPVAAIPHTGQPPLPAATVPQQVVTATQETNAWLDRIEAEWTACLLLERQLAGVRKKTASMLSKLTSLDKDLSPEERLHADRQDINDWQDARRWLKDVSSRAHRYVKEHDIGITSLAGKRSSFETTYHDVVRPRRAVEGLELLQREFNSYRKMLQTLLNNMNNAYMTAQQDGERRAQRILARIRSKARSGKSSVSRDRRR